MELVFSLLQQLSVYLVLAYLLSKTPLFLPITTISGRWSHRFLCYIIFSGFCILGTYFGLAIQDAINEKCKLGSALVIPLIGANNEVIGTIKLYEPKLKLFSYINLTLGEGIAKLLSNQILAGRYLQQQTLLTQVELRLLQAQVNPHFLFNALNTISAVIRRDPNRARELIQHLSQFFRRNLKQNFEQVTLKEELHHVQSYLEIELARFADRLTVTIDVDNSLYSLKLPTFNC